jgi:hypothetical protein
MSIRYNEVNSGGIVTVSGGNMPTNAYTNNDPYISRVGTVVGNTVVTPVVISNGHAVEQDGDGGCWDTVSGVNVDINKTNIGCINL